MEKKRKKKKKKSTRWWDQIKMKPASPPHLPKLTHTACHALRAGPSLLAWTSGSTQGACISTPIPLQPPHPTHQICMFKDKHVTGPSVDRPCSTPGPSAFAYRGLCHGSVPPTTGLNPRRSHSSQPCRDWLHIQHTLGIREDEIHSFPTLRKKKRDLSLVLLSIM